MDRAPENANPTILNESQLPSRQKRGTPRKGPDTKYSDIIFAKPSYLSRPFQDRVTGHPNLGLSSPWRDLDEQDHDFAEEPIDEQEIYGTLHALLNLPLSPWFPFIPLSHSLFKCQDWVSFTVQSSKLMCPATLFPDDVAKILPCSDIFPILSL